MNKEDQCQFCYYAEGDRSKVSLFCHRYAPKPVTTIEGGIDDYEAAWPIVFCEEKCGEFKRD